MTDLHDKSYLSSAFSIKMGGRDRGCIKMIKHVPDILWHGFSKWVPKTPQPNSRICLKLFKGVVPCPSNSRVACFLNLCIAGQKYHPKSSKPIASSTKCYFFGWCSNGFCSFLEPIASSTECYFLVDFLVVSFLEASPGTVASLSD